MTENEVILVVDGSEDVVRTAVDASGSPGSWRWRLEARGSDATLVSLAGTDDVATLTAALERVADQAARPIDLPALFAGISVADFEGAQRWYARLFGKEPSFHPNDVEAVWELAGSRSVYVQHRPEHAGHALVTLFVSDIGATVDDIASRGLEPDQDETYDNGVRKVAYRDPEGNEIGFGGG